MFSLLLAVIYISFISLGLPDSLLGSAWPVMKDALGAPISYAGIISMIIACGTIVSSLFTGKVVYRFGTGKVTAFSVALTAGALFGFAFSDSFLALCLFSIPYGFGAGAVDAALNNYVATHCSSRQMSWLHAFWGVGVSISPNIMSFCLTRGLGWQMGYMSVALLQSLLVLLLVLSLPLWKGEKMEKSERSESSPSIKAALKIKGVPFILLAFFAFCSLETTAGLWASSYMVERLGLSVERAAGFASLFYIGEMSGRFINGFIADKFGDKTMVRAGGILMALSCVALLIPFPSHSPSLIALLTLGLGAAPIYPCLIHLTPKNFGKDHSQTVISVEMACAYFGTSFMPPLFGLIAEHITIGIYPLYLTLFALGVLFCSELMNRICKDDVLKEG